MPRIARKYLNGNIFHIVVQGINKENIFEHDYQKAKYKGFLKLNKGNVKIIAYCIMSNHAHILVYTEDLKELSKFMQKANTKYAVYYNKENTRVGYVFRNRFNTQEIRDENYFKNCIVYIHRNPVKAGIVKDEGQYKFSSYNEYIKESYLISKNMAKSILGIRNIETLKREIYLMHRNNIEYKFSEIPDEINYNEIINIYQKEGLNNKEIVRKLRNEYKLSERYLSKIMYVTRHQIRQYLE